MKDGGLGRGGRKGVSRLDRSRLLDFKYCPPGVINTAQDSDQLYFCYFQIVRNIEIMRTPKHKRILQKAKSSATNRLRKKAMKNKVMKKTMLDIGGDDTREEVRDLMNESDLSLAGVVSRNLSWVFHGKYF